MPRTLQYLSIGLTALALIFTSCNSKDTDGDEPLEIKDCPPGQTLDPNGQCIRASTNNGMNADVGPTDGTSDDSDGTSQADGSDDDGSTKEDGGSSGCAGGCPKDKFCLEGTCRPGSQCNAGEVLGCYDERTLRRCTEKGIGFTTEQCPSEKPNCVDFQKPGCDMNVPKCFDSKCTKKSCSPDEKFCQGNDLMKCSSDGKSQSKVKTCRGGCRGGKCVSACSGNAKSYIGCGFYAVDLDNYKISCNRQCPTGKCQPGLFGGGTCASNGQSCTPQCGTQLSGGTCLKSGACKERNADRQDFAVTVSNTTMRLIDVKVKDGSGSTVKSTSLQANSLKVIDLPRADKDGSYLAKNGYRIEATGPVTVHQFNPKNQADVFTNDASLLLPSNALGTEYRVIGWPSRPGPQPRSSTSNKAYVTIVAVEETPMRKETKVTVDTPVKIISGNGVQSISANSKKTFTMTKGQVLSLAVDKSPGTDPTGMHITTKGNKVAVFSAHQCANVPSDTSFCDHMEQQLYPVDTWDKEYVLSKFEPRGTEDDVFRVLAAQDGTKLTTKPSISGVDGKTLNKGEFVEFKSQKSVYLKASKPVAAGQFMVGSGYPGPSKGCDPANNQMSGCVITKRCKNKPTGIGDPAFLLNVPTGQYRKDYVVQTPKGYQEDHLNIVAPPGAKISIDGTNLSASGTQVGNTNWEVIRKKVQPGVHAIKADKPVGLYAYGYECDVSYAYPGGLDLAATGRVP